MSDDPRVSVIIPVYNDPEGIRTTLRSLEAQSCPETVHEVIIVDNDSTDETSSVIREFCERNPGTMNMYVEDDVQNSYAARNTGIEEATGEILAFVDADEWMDEDWVRRIIESMEGTERRYVGTDVEMVMPSSDRSLAAHYNYVFGFSVEEEIERRQFAPTCCLLVRKSVINDVGAFDERLVSGGDLEFGQRVYAEGYDVHYEHGITVYHPVRRTLSSLLWRSYRIGKGQGQRHRYYPIRYGSEPLFSVRDFLPANPVTFYDRTKNYSPSAYHLFGMFLIMYILNLVNVLGRASALLHEGSVRTD
jgi:glycosyltransferase involved in cell wall biosynthesis